MAGQGVEGYGWAETSRSRKVKGPFRVCESSMLSEHHSSQPHIEQVATLDVRDIIAEGESA